MNFNAKQLQQMSNVVRSNALGAVLSANSGHIGIVLDAAEMITVIFANYLRKGIDRFVLSAGHGSALLYSVLKLAGYKIKNLNSFRKLGGLPGHPEYGIDGVDATTGPLGQGVANAVGLALSQKIKHLKAYTYCICSDGDLMEGVSFEAMSLAGRLKLNNLIVLWDDNKRSIDGVAQVDLDVNTRMRSMGWQVMSVNGDDVSALDKALVKAKRAFHPVFIQCKNILGRGSSLQNSSKAHGFALDKAELLSLISENISVEGDLLWKQVAEEPIADTLKRNATIPSFTLPVSTNNISTRDLSGLYLENLMSRGIELIGGSADLSDNVRVKTSKSISITADNFDGNFIDYGVREHAMAAIINGIIAGGIRAFCSTFLVFSDYMKPAMRIAALSGLPAIYVFSHDSICVGEDGPTHQPIEQMASLRSVPNINLFRPCNLTEVDHAWRTALKEQHTPSIIVLSRQSFKQIPSPDNVNLSKGAYIIYKSKTKYPRITLFATGSEIPLAVDIASHFKDIQVVSMVNMLDFRKQDDTYKLQILKGHVIAIEAGSPTCWFEFADAVIGVDKFGSTGDHKTLYKEYGFDIDSIIAEIKKYIK